VGASIGQHYRHSMVGLSFFQNVMQWVCCQLQANVHLMVPHFLSQDHVELAALISSTLSDKSSQPRELHYDLRVRGGTLERDLIESRKRIVGVIDIFQSIDPDATALISTPVTPYFNLSADSDAEMGVPSTIGRELGFVAHHAIHHMAMVKIIAVKTLSIKECELPNGFGRAPSTIIFDELRK
jgi:hypothetical protein